jgi:hypothetical protein
MGEDNMTGEPAEFRSKDQIVIALDFSTTFSGIAYAFRKNEKPDIMSISD